MTPIGPTYRLRVSYLGTRYAGWQVQPAGDTVQGRLEGALERLFETPVSVHGAGRTDAGVHARGQVAHLIAPAPRPAATLKKALNALLPGDIRVEAASRAADGFHARKDATGKLYRYLLHVGAKPSPFEQAQVGRIAGASPEVAPMQDAARHLTGRHDFSAFCGAGTAVEDRRRTVTALRIARRGEVIRFWVEGDGFLRHQVRNMVGTLVEVGRGRHAADAMPDLLASRDRRRAGPTAPAAGLCLMHVTYRGKR